MIKICYYEVKRILSNSLFWVSLLIGMIYAFQIFITDIVRGISYTAPFSGWSYGFFLSKISIFICIIGFFMVSKNYSKREKEKTKLIYAENKLTKNYLNYKTCVSFIAAFLMVSCIVIFSFILYASIFHYFEFSKFIAIIFFAMIPPLLFTMGLSTFFFTINAWLANIFMVLLLGVEFLLSKNGLSIFGSFFFENTPLLSSTTPEFFLTNTFVFSRLIMIGIGLVAFWLVPKMAAKEHTIRNAAVLKNK